MKSPKKIVTEVEKPEEKNVDESLKEVISSKSSLLKRMRNLSHKHRTSSDDHSPLIRKAQLNLKGVLVREIPTPRSPSTKKRRAEDLAKKISKKSKKRKLVIHDLSSDSEIIPETPLGSYS